MATPKSTIRPKIDELIEPVRHLLVPAVDDLIHVAADAPVAPKGWLVSRQKKTESVFEMMAGVALSNPDWFKAVVAEVFNDEARMAVAEAYSGDAALREDETAARLLGVMERLGRHMQLLPWWYFRFAADQEHRAPVVLRVAGRLDAAMAATGERRALATLDVASAGLFEPLYDDYLRALLACVKLMHGKVPDGPSAFGSLVDEVAKTNPPSDLLDVDTSFFRNAIQHGHVDYDPRGTYLTFTNRGAKPRTMKLRTTDVLARFQRMFTTATQSSLTALSVYISRSMLRSGVLDVLFEEVPRLANARDDERDRLMVDALLKLGGHWFRALGLDHPALAADIPAEFLGRPLQGP
jgi:hypothetical protein